MCLNRTISGRLAALALAVAGCDANETSGIERFGFVQLSLPKVEPAVARARASFSNAVGRAAPNCGVSSNLGTCEFWLCDDALYTQPLTGEGLDVGAIDISGTQQDLALSADENGNYASEVELGEGDTFWNRGDMLRAHVAGSKSFPEMTASLVAPANSLEVTSPTEGDLALKKDAPFAFTWTPQESGTVNISVGTETLTTSGETRVLAALYCYFPAPNGSASLSADVISKLPKPPGLQRYTVDIFLYAGSDVGRDRAALSFQVTTVGYSGHATIE